VRPSIIESQVNSFLDYTTDLVDAKMALRIIYFAYNTGYLTWNIRISVKVALHIGCTLRDATPGSRIYTPLTYHFLYGLSNRLPNNKRLVVFYDAPIMLTRGRELSLHLIDDLCGAVLRLLTERTWEVTR